MKMKAGISIFSWKASTNGSSLSFQMCGIFGTNCPVLRFQSPRLQHNHETPPPYWSLWLESVHSPTCCMVSLFPLLPHWDEGRVISTEQEGARDSPRKEFHFLIPSQRLELEIHPLQLEAQTSHIKTEQVWAVPIQDGRTGFWGVLTPSVNDPSRMCWFLPVTRCQDTIQSRIILKQMNKFFPYTVLDFQHVALDLS